MGHWEDTADTTCRIFDKNHLLDATEIFRKLNVHKKVRHPYLKHLPCDIAFRIRGYKRLTWHV